jgi:hypothetical protein
LIRNHKNGTPAITWTSGDSGIMVITPQELTEGYLLMNNGASCQFENEDAVTVSIQASGEGGVNSGTTISANSWYYLYAVPRSSNNRYVAVIIDDEPPGTGTGPAGYSTWKYLGPMKISSTTTVLPSDQVGRMWCQSSYITHDVYKSYSGFGGGRSANTWYSEGSYLGQYLPDSTGVIDWQQAHVVTGSANGGIYFVYATSPGAPTESVSGAFDNYGPGAVVHGSGPSVTTNLNFFMHTYTTYTFEGNEVLYVRGTDITATNLQSRIAPWSHTERYV